MKKTRDWPGYARVSLFWMVAFVAIGGVAATCVQLLSGSRKESRHDAAAIVQRAVLPSPAFASSGMGGEPVVIADVAEKTVSSVVNIWATKTTQTSLPNVGPFSRDPFFRDFFGPHFFERIPRERRQRSLGSGVIVASTGIILTNNHVVENTEDLRITLTNGRDFGAKIIGSDAKSDVAILQLEGTVDGLKALPFGDSESMRLGDVVIAIGNPFGVGQTVTMGIVSAFGRGNVGIVDYEDFIQTDAAINPGNSGGALVNMRGELIGLNTAIVSRSGGYQGVGFAIPSNLAKPTMDKLLESGTIVRGWLGVAIQDLDEDLAKGLGLAITSGVLISDVTSDSPAEKAGLKRGDVIVEVDGEAMTSTSKLRNKVALAGPKAKVRLGVFRDGKNRSLVVTLGELTDDADVATSVESSTKSTPLGFSVGPLDEAMRKKYDISEKVRDGIVITEVDDGGSGARVGLRPGDVIVELDRKKVKSVGDFEARVAQSKGIVLLLVKRDGATIFVAMTKQH